MFLIVVAAVADRGGNISEDAYTRIVEGLTYFSLFEDFAIESQEVKTEVLTLLSDQGRETVLKHAADVLPKREDSPLREFAYILATCFIHSDLGPADRFDKYNQITDVRDALGLKIGVRGLSEALMNR